MAGSKNKVVISYEQGHKTIDGIEYKLCNKCFSWFELNDKNFYKNKCSPDGYFPNCKECNIKASSKRQEENKEYCAEYMREYYKNNTETMIDNAKKAQKAKPEHYKQKQKEWQQKNPDKCKGYNQQHDTHKITIQEWEACKKYFIHRCAYCGLPIEEHWVSFNEGIVLGDFHREHVDHKGVNDLSNCVPSCKSCNSSKHTDTLEEWYNKNNPKFDQERLNRIEQWLFQDYQKYLT